MVVKNLTQLKNRLRRVGEITVTLDFNFRLILCSREDLSYNNTARHLKAVLVNVVQEIRLETPFKSDSVNS